MAVGLRDPEQLTAALSAMPSDIAEFLVEQTVTGIVAEVLVSIRRSAPLGWLITVGAGGVLTELWKDTQCILAPATAQRHAWRIAEVADRSNFEWLPRQSLLPTSNHSSVQY